MIRFKKSDVPFLIFPILLTISMHKIYGFRAAQSLTLGIVFGLINFQLLKWSWKNILNKKLIALSTSVIVIKYSIFVAIIYLVLNSNQLLISWFAMGFTIILITIILKFTLRNK